MRAGRSECPHRPREARLLADRARRTAKGQGDSVKSVPRLLCRAPSASTGRPRPRPWRRRSRAPRTCSGSHRGCDDLVALDRVADRLHAGLVLPDRQQHHAESRLGRAAEREVRDRRHAEHEPVERLRGERNGEEPGNGQGRARKVKAVLVDVSVVEGPAECVDTMRASRLAPRRQSISLRAGRTQETLGTARGPNRRNIRRTWAVAVTFCAQDPFEASRRAV